MTYMTFLGICGPAHDWFTSYISGRCQNVTVASQCLSAASLMCGVPQSSVLGSVELIMYMEDLVSVIDHLPPVSPHYCAQLLTSSSLDGITTCTRAVRAWCSMRQPITMSRLLVSFTFSARLARFLIKTAEIVWYAGMFLHLDTNRLLQRAVCRTLGFHSSAFTACSSRCCSFCRRSSTTRPHHSSSDGTTLAACASTYHIHTTRYVLWCTQSCMDTGQSTWWTLWCLCHNLLADPSSTFSSKGEFETPRIHTTLG